jgi:hypothetical protein
MAVQWAAPIAQVAKGNRSDRWHPPDRTGFEAGRFEASQRLQDALRGKDPLVSQH